MGKKLVPPESHCKGKEDFIMVSEVACPPKEEINLCSVGQWGMSPR